MTETELQHQSELADARLEIAEDLWWPIAILIAVALHLKWGNWFLDAFSFVAVYFLIVHGYRRAADKAEDEYFKVARLGKYASSSREEHV